MQMTIAGFFVGLGGLLLAVLIAADAKTEGIVVASFCVVVAIFIAGPVVQDHLGWKKGIEDWIHRRLEPRREEKWGRKVEIDHGSVEVLFGDPMQAEQPGSWECPYCLGLNHIDQDECVGCGAVLNRERERARPES